MSRQVATTRSMYRPLRHAFMLSCTLLHHKANLTGCYLQANVDGHERVEGGIRNATQDLIEVRPVIDDNRLYNVCI